MPISAALKCKINGSEDRRRVKQMQREEWVSKCGPFAAARLVMDSLKL